MATDRNPGLLADPLFVGLTRPPMRFGATYTALMVNGLVTMEAFLVTKNLLTLLVCLPVHGVCVLLCLRDPRIFELLALWARTRLPAIVGTGAFWRASSVAPLAAFAHRGGRPVLPECVP
jgi:type IV secretion system protein VirB3